MDTKDYRDLHYVLEKSGLADLYPGKITREKLFELTEYSRYGCSLIKVESISQLCSVFIYKLRFYHSNARNIQLAKAPAASYLEERRNPRSTDTSYLHPLDVTTAFFLCCDPIAKQDFVSLLWTCKFAIPLVIQTEQLEPLNLFMWPLRSILYTPQNATFDKRVTNCEMRTISFVRFGKTVQSKSMLLNRLVCQSETEHSTFFHRDCTATKKIRSEIVNGMIEVTFTPLPDIGDCMFLNLRGDIRDHVLQANMLSRITSAFVVTCKLEDIYESKCLIKKIEAKTHKIGLLFLLTNTSLAEGSNDEVTMNNFLERYQNKIVIDVIPLQDLGKCDIMEYITLFIKGVDFQKISVDDIPQLSNDLVMLDEEDTKYENPLLTANVILESVRRSHDELIGHMFPLQGTIFQNWSLANKEFYRLKQIEDEDVQTYRDNILHKKDACRVQQMKLLKNEDLLITKFIALFTNKDNDELQRQLSLRMLSHRLSDLTLENITSIQNEYKQILSRKGSCNLNDDHYAPKLLELEKKMTNASITLSHFTKELGQAFEATEISDTNNCQHKGFPLIAVQTLLDGYPLELMDGTSTSVPILWVSAVLRQLHETLKKRENRKHVKVKVISVLGIQSTGKSTLLNTMFGSQFPVSSGRCTRGVHLHIVKVSNQSSWAKSIDYVLLIDTEGISALEYYADSSRERELATFILGLANTTIINIMSENTIYLRDILPISVHAFLRMDLVGLDPRCVIVHQNVDRMNIQVIWKQWSDLEGKLDEYTKAACELERVPVRRFQDAVRLNIKKDLHCVSSYRKHCGNIETVSSGYSETAMELVRNTIAEEDGAFLSLEEFEKHTRLLWEAIKRDNFVYEFRNTIEAEARSVIDHHWCLLSWKLRQSARKCVADFETEITTCRTVNECTTKCEDCCKRLRKETEICLLQVSDEFKSVFKNAKSTLFEEPFKRWKTTVHLELKTLSERVIERSISDLTVTRNNTCRYIKLKIEDSQTESDIADFIQDALNKGQADNHYPRHLNILYTKWIKHVGSQQTIDSGVNHMESVALKTLFEAFPAHKTILEDKLKAKAIQTFTLSEFTIKDEYFSHLSRRMVDKIKEQKLLAQIVFTNILEAVRALLRQRKSERKKFDNDVFADILVKLKSEEHISKGYLATRITFQIDLALSLVGHSITSLKETEVENVLPDVHKGLYEAKCRFGNIYHSIISSNNEKVKKILGILEIGIHREFIRIIRQSLIEELETFEEFGVKVLTSKRTFLVYILLQLVKEQDLLDIDSYLLYPTGSMRNWICHIYDKLTGIYEGSERESVHRLPNKVVDELFRKTSNSLKIICSATEDGDHWIDQFKEKLNFVVSVEDIRTVVSGPEIPFLKSELCGMFSNFEEEVKKNAREMFYEREYDNIKQSVTEPFRESLCGCENVCPNCNEICAYGQTNHSGSHNVMLHRPVDAIDMICKDGGESDVRSCYELLSKKTLSESLDKTDLSLWDAEPILIGNESVWQFICSKFRNSELNTVTTIPHVWTTWNLENEIGKLACVLKDLE